ncbi:MAG TPA: transglycosylase domain-containing protein [Candidatus Polarisedimenticolaceae bacterium]|nr:transglycosylase domain-containing protein [Candidatus Polarisedimenticolaceae bacterium]
MAKRRVRGDRKVIRGGDRSFKARALLFFGSFTSFSRFKRYWLSADGARRIGIIVGTGLLAIVALFAYFAKDLPSPGKINARIGAQNTVFYDRTGQTKIFEIHGDKNRKVVEFNQMPKDLRNATIAIEDRNFYKEGAFSVNGTLRAAFYNFTKRGRFQGGSTITQQYVKNALLNPSDFSITRKIKELILSIEIDQLYKKDDILRLYLNEIPYGSQAYGVEAACRTFFPGNIKDDNCSAQMTLSQSATFAAMANLPTYYSPYGQHLEALKSRQALVLNTMAQQKYITQEEADAAKVTDFAAIGLAPAPQIATQVSPYPHFAQYAQEYLENKYGTRTVESGGLKVITSLDIKKQKLMERAINGPNGITAVRHSGGSNVAMVSGDPKTGQVLAMMGSYDPNDKDFGAFNVALANRQPGSSFKPIVYATAMKGNWGPGSTLYDVKTDFGGGYVPKNYSGGNYGVQSIRTALAGSLNIPAVKMLYIAGVADSIKTAHALGISTLNMPASHYGLTLVLGSGEVKLNDMVNAYESFANGGVHHEATPILKITDPRQHVLMDTSKPTKPKRVLDAQISYLMANIMSDTKARQYIFGANNPLQINGRTVAAKTGTTTDFKDAWTMGYTPDLVTGVWAGNNNNQPMTSEAVDIAAPLWHDYMAGYTDRKTREKVPGALDEYPTTSNWTAPPGIQSLTIDADTGGAVTAATRRRRTDVFPSWYKPQAAGGLKTATIDKVTGKLATECTPPAAVQTVTAGQVHAEIASTDEAYTRWQTPVAALARSLGYSSGGGAIPTEKDNLHSCSDTKPAVNVSVSGNSTLVITANVTSGTHTANALTFYFDDQIISTQAINGSTSYSFSYDAPASGSHTIKAVVTDVALYSGQDETTVNTVATGGFVGSFPPSPANGSFISSNTPVTFAWGPGGNGNYKLVVTRTPGPQPAPNPTSPATSRTYASGFGIPGVYQWHVESAGDNTPTYTFTVTP